MRSRAGAPRKLCVSESRLSYDDAPIHIVYIKPGRADKQGESPDPSWYARWSRLKSAQSRGPVPPRRVPSGPECGFCELTKAAIPERIDAGVTAA